MQTWQAPLQQHPLYGRSAGRSLPCCWMPCPAAGVVGHTLPCTGAASSGKKSRRRDFKHPWCNPTDGLQARFSKHLVPANIAEAL